MKLRNQSNYPVITTEFKNLAELAAVMQTSTKTAQRVLSGTRPFYHTEKERISTYLGLSIDEVFANV